LYYRGTAGRFVVVGKQRAAHHPSAMASTEKQDPEGLVGPGLLMGAAMIITCFLKSLPTV